MCFLFYFILLWRKVHISVICFIFYFYFYLFYFLLQTFKFYSG